MKTLLTHLESIKKAKGAEFLRNLVLYLNNRDEFINDNKSVLTLIAEYRNFLNTL